MENFGNATSALAEYRKAQAAVAEQAQLDQDDATAAISDQAKLEQLNVRKTNQAGLRYVDGDAAAPIDPALEAAIVKTKDRIASREAGREIRKGRLDVLSSVRDEARSKLANFATEECHMMRSSAEQRFLLMAAELQVPLAEMIAADLVENALAGSGFAYRKPLPLFSGVKVARAFLDNISRNRLRPPALDLEIIESEARRISKELLSKIRGA